MKYFPLLLVFTSLGINSCAWGGGAGAGAVAQGMQSAQQSEDEDRALQLRNQQMELRLQQMQDEEQRRNFITSVLNSVNSNLPTMIDNITRLDRLVFNEGLFEYTYTIIDKDKNQITQKTKDLIYANLKNNSCTNSSLITEMKMGYAVGYLYRDKYGANAMEFVYRLSDCQ